MLRDARFSVEREKADLVQQYRDVIPMELIGETGAMRSMLLMDPPHHTRVRGLVSKAFTPRRVAELEPRIQSIIDELLADTGSEGQLALTALIDRFPDMKLSEGEVEFRKHPILRGLTSLPVRLSPA